MKNIDTQIMNLLHNQFNKCYEINKLSHVINDLIQDGP